MEDLSRHLSSVHDDIRGHLRGAHGDLTLAEAIEWKNIVGSKEDNCEEVQYHRDGRRMTFEVT